MRTNRDGQRRFFVNVTKFAILLMCFATVFAVVLTAGVLDTGFDSGANVAEAESSWGSSNPVAGSSLTMGGTSYSPTATLGTNDIKSFQEYIHSESSNSFTMTLDFDSTTFSSSAGVYGWTNGDSGENWDSGQNVFGFGQSRNGVSGVYVNANVTIPAIILSLMSSGYKVEAYWTSDLESYDDGNPTCYVGIIASNGGRQITSANDSEWILDSGFEMGRSSNGRQSYSISLSGSVDTLSLCVFRGYATAIFGRQVRIKAKNPSVTFTITPPSDENAPTITAVDSNNSTLTTNVGQYFNNSSPIASSITGSANSLRDNVTPNSSSITMTQAIARADSISVGDGSYAKKLTVTVTDRNASGGNASSTAAAYYAGVSTISIGGATTAVSYGSQVTATGTYTADNGEAGSVYVEWTANAARDAGVLTLYFSHNTSEALTLTLSDSGNNSTPITVNVGGIVYGETDISGTTVGHNSTPQWVVADAADGSWAWVWQQTLGGLSMNNVPTTPTVWFYSVERADSAAWGTAPAASDDSTAWGWQPLGYTTNGSASVSSYDFGTGEFKFNSISGGTDINGRPGATGNGYYRFTFYAMNYAGFVSEDTITVYIKVDYTAPTNTVELTYNTQSGVAQGDLDPIGTISPTETVYVSTSITATINFTPNISGNRVLILGADGESYVVYIVNNVITKVTSSTDGSVQSAAWSEAEGVWTMTGDSYALASVSVAIEAGADSSYNLTVVYTGKPNSDFTRAHNFTVKNNADATGAFNTATGINGGASAEDDAWADVGGARIYLDMTAPVAPDVSESGSTDETDHIVVTTGRIPTGGDRKWYTDGWSMSAQPSVQSDDSYYRIYYSTAYYATEAAFAEAYQQKLSDFASVNAGGIEAFFGEYRDVLDIDVIEPFDLLFQNDGANAVGYYVVYIAGLDRAGNISELAAYGVLVDANDYIIGAQIAQESTDHFGSNHNVWNFTFVNEEGETVGSYKRGETVYFSAELTGAYAYVPYEIKKYGADGQVVDTPIYTHPSDNFETGFVEEGVAGDYAYTDGGRLALRVDRSDISALPAVSGGAQIVFSYRRVVSAAFSNNQADYTGAAIEFPVVLTGVTVDGTVGETVTLTDNLPYTVVYPYSTDEVTHAGAYSLAIRRADSEFYVLNEEVEDYAVTVNKADLEIQITVNGEGATYGDVTAENLAGLFSYEIISGLVGADADANTPFEDLDGMSAALSLGGIQSGYIPAATYTAITAEFATTDYDVSFNWGEGNSFSLTIAARGLEVTAEDVAQDYGTALPETYVVTMPKDLGFVDSFASYQTAEQIAAIFGIETSAVTDADDNWSIELPADYVLTDTANNTFGFVNAGTYAFTGIEQGDINSNFTVAFAEENGGITVNPVTVTVTPAEGQEFTAEDEEAIAGLQVRFDDSNPAVSTFGISGWLLVGSAVEGGESTYNVSASAEHLTSSHNTQDVKNVIINVDPDSVTVTIILRSDLSGTLTVTFHDNIVFSTVYGTLWDRDALMNPDNYDVDFAANGDSTTAPTSYDVEITAVNVSNYDFDNLLHNGVQTRYTITFVYTYTVMNGEEEATGQFEVVFVDSEGNNVNGAQLSVTPFEVSLTDADLNNNSKIYGDRDSALNFTYAFAALPEGYQSEYGLPAISGVVREGEDGAAAGRYDDADVYGIDWSQAEMADGNLVLDTTNLEEIFGGLTFTINQRELNLESAILTGQNKYYDGSSDASGSINIEALLLNNDSVSVEFDAEYWDGTQAVAEFGNDYSVRFYNLALSGTDAGNYIIPESITELITDAIYRIMQEIIAVNKEHFVVNKTYDGNTAIGTDDITISSSSALFGREFSYIFGTFTVSDAGAVIIDTLQLWFPDLAWIGDGIVEEYYNLGMDVEVHAYESGEGTVFEISNLSGTIDARTITPDDIVFNFAMSRAYDGETAVEVTFEVTAEFAGQITGFDISDLGLAFVAGTSSKNVGNYVVDFTDVTLGSANYALSSEFTADGCAALERKVNGSVTEDGEGAPYSIVRKELTLEIAFPDKVYDGESTINPSGIEPEVSGLVGEESITVDATAYTYSDAQGAPDQYVQGTAENGWLHYVTVSGFRITPDGASGFDWGNYTFSSSSVDLDGMPTSGSEQYTIETYIMADAAVLSPRSISVTLNDIKANDKVYDNTTTATLDLSAVTNNSINANDRAAFTDGRVVYTYNAAFDTNSPNVGTHNVKVDSLGIAVGVSEDSEDYDPATRIARSYVFAFSGSITTGLTANITPAPLAVEFTLPSKTYDGLAYTGIDETKLTVGEGITLTGFVEAESYASNYNVTVYGAGYNPEDIDVQDGRVNTGFVYGFVLTNSRGPVNYYLVFGSNESAIEGFEQVTELGGLANLKEGDEGYYAYYYEFAATEYYVASESELRAIAADENIYAKLDVLADFVYNNETLYILGVKDGQTLTEEEITQLGDYGALSQEFRRADATGSIDPARIGFTVNPVNNDKFTKPFDDTATLTGPEYNVDYTVELTLEDGSELGQVGYKIGNISISFVDANVGTGKDVVFTIDGIVDGDNMAVDTNNFVFNTEDNSYTVSRLGSITAATNSVEVQLMDGSGESTEGLTGTYGGEIAHSVKYTFNGKNILVDADGYAYILASDWAEAFGHGADVPQPVGRSYVNNGDGTFTLNAAGEYIRINGTFSQAVPVTADGNEIFSAADGTLAVGAGTYSRCVVNVKATNFNINQQTSTVTVNKATLNVTVSGNYTGDGGYTFVADYYVGTLPAPAFAVQSGLASVDNADDILAQIGYGYTLNGAAIDIATADITENAGADYVLTVDDSRLANYDVVIVGADGVSVTHTLLIKLPDLSKTYTVPEDLEKPYQSGEAVSLDMIVNGLDDFDKTAETTVEWRQGDTVLESAPVNAGEYTWSVTVRRLIDDGNDERNYYYVGEFTAPGSFVINQRSVIVTPDENLGFTYDGEEHIIDLDKLSATDALSREEVIGFFDDISVGYTLNGEAVDAMLNAGGYSVVLTVGGDFVGNYVIENRIGTIRVAQAPVVVTVDAASRTHDVTDGSDGCEITFTAQGLDTDDFTVTYRNSSGVVVSSVTTAGVYTYTITSNDPNYYVSGGGTGNLTATISRVTYTVDEIDYVTVDFGDNPVTVNYTLNNSIVAEGTSFWNIVDSNVQALATEDEVLTTSSIVNVDMLNGNTYVSTLGNEVTVTVRMPDGVSGDYRVYYVTSNGELAELSDYTVSNGYITYTTNYISDLVFVNVSAPGLVWWIWPLIAALAILIIAIAILVAVLVKLHRAPDPVPVEVAPIDSIMPAPVAPAPVDLPVAAADIEPVNYDAPAAVSKHRQPPTIGIR